MPPDPLTIFRLFAEGGDSGAVVSSPAFLMAKFVFVAVSLFFLFHAVYLLYKTGAIASKMKFYREAARREKTPLRKDEFLIAWNAVRARMDAMREADWKLAVIEADKLMDEALKRMGYKGKDMGERLKLLTREQLSNLSDVWKAHKARNLLSHDTDYHLSLTEAQWMIQTFEEAFKEMQLLAP